MAFKDNFPSIRPTLLLDFANAKALDPRITFTRASTATYYDFDTVAKAEENLLTYSQDFDNAAWTKVAASIGANATAAPDGTTTADYLQGDGTNARHDVGRSSVTGQKYFSVFLKPNGVDWVQITTSDSGNGVLNVNATTGAIGTTGSGFLTPVMTSVGNGWYRLSVNMSVTDGFLRIGLVSSSSSARLEAWTTAAGVYLWGAQLEQRSSVTAYTPTTTAPITNYVPQLLTAAAGAPRFTHDPITNDSLGLLIEEARANLLLRSEEFQTTWTIAGTAGVVTNGIAAPDGATTADKFVLGNTVTSGNASVYQDVTKPAVSAAYTASVYVKAGEFNSLRVLIRDAASSSNFVQAYFNLATGAIAQAGNASGTFTAASAAIASVGNGWYRVSVTGTSSTETGLSLRLLSYQDGTGTATGNGYSGIYVWGAQLEAGAFPTSYIPTVASQVTRAGDLAVMTGTNLSSWFNPNESTFYAEASTMSLPANIYHYICSLSLGTSTSAGDFLRMAFLYTSKVDFTVGNSNTFTTLNTTSTPSITVDVPRKSAIAVAAQDLVGVTASWTPSTSAARSRVALVDTLTIGSQAAVSSNRALNGTIKKIAYYPERLTSAQLQALTQ